MPCGKSQEVPGLKMKKYFDPHSSFLFTKAHSEYIGT